MGEFSAFFDDAFVCPVMAVFRGLGVETSVSLAHTAWDLGIDAVEVPVQSSADVEALAAVVVAARARGKIAGAGTVVQPDQVNKARRAGAMFAVSPSLDLGIVRQSWDAGVPMMPGVATPTELAAAVAFGLRWVKAFPAVTLGPNWFRAVLGPFPGIRFVATGGLDAHNVADFLDAGVTVVGVGSALRDASQLSQLGALLNARTRLMTHEG